MLTVDPYVYGPESEAALQDGTRNGDPPRGDSLVHAARSLTHLACRGRIVASWWFRLDAYVPVAGALDLLRYRYPETNSNGTRLAFWAMYLYTDPAVSPGTVPLASVDAGATEVLAPALSDVAPVAPADIGFCTGEVTLAPGGAQAPNLLAVEDGAHLLSLCIFERPSATTPYRIDETGAAFGVNHLGFSPGRLIAEPGPLVDFRETQEECFRFVRGIVCGSTVGQAVGQARIATTTDWINLIDGTTGAAFPATPRTANTAGEVFHSYLCGRGLEATANASVGVYAEAVNLGVGEFGEVLFESSVGSVVVPNIIAGATWCDGATKVPLATDGAVDGVANREWDHVDICGRVTADGAGQELRVWGWEIVNDPD